MDLSADDLIRKFAEKHGKPPPPHLLEIIVKACEARAAGIDPFETSWQRKTRVILAEAGKTSNLSASAPAPEVIERIQWALKREFGAEVAREIGFHLSDWSSEAAFLTALHLCPKRFNKTEIRDAVAALTIHGVHHLAAATRLTGGAIWDIWQLGVEIDELVEGE